MGVLKDVLQYPGNDVWVVRGEKEYLIPAVSAFIRDIDLPAGRAEVTLLEGMETDAH